MPIWDGTTCANTYCHGAPLSGGTNTVPEWTRVGDDQAACGTCHGLPPADGHPPLDNCVDCHADVVDADRNIVAADLHINGRVDATVECGTCHALPPATGSHQLHAGLAAPVYGAVGTAADLPAPAGYAFGCGHCHPIDPSFHINGGRAEVLLRDPDAPDGSLKADNPESAHYAPGAEVQVDEHGIEYTLGTCSDVACHRGTSTTSGAVPRPGIDFPFEGYPIAYPPYDVQRESVYTNPTWGAPRTDCGACHGYPPRTAWPDTDGGAGESHSYITADGYEDLHAYNHGFAPIPCRTCHAATVDVAAVYERDLMDVVTLEDIPITGFDRHVNGTADIVFDRVEPIAYRQPMHLETATWDAQTRSCNNVECHFGQTSVTAGLPLRKDNAAECSVCHRP